MNLTDQQIAHILACLRIRQNKDISHMPHFEDAEPLSNDQVNELCEQISAGEPDDGRYTVVGLFPDSDWGSSMWDASFVETVDAATPTEAAQTASIQAARNRVMHGEDLDESAVEEHIQDKADDIAILAVFSGEHVDMYDPDEREA